MIKLRHPAIHAKHWARFRSYGAAVCCSTALVLLDALLKELHGIFVPQRTVPALEPALETGWLLSLFHDVDGDIAAVRGVGVQIVLS